MSKLGGKNVVIFGGSSGVGKAAAKFVVAAGGIAYITGRDVAKLDAAKAEILGNVSEDAAGHVHAATANLQDEESIKALFEAYEPGFFTHLVVTAGNSNDTHSILGASGLAGIRAQFDMKFFAQLAAVSYGAPRLADGGSIVLTTGALAKRPGKGNTALAVANAALDNMVKGLANDLGPRLRINTVSPGLTDTEMWNGMPPETKAAMLAGFGKTVPLGRAGKVDDVAHAILFLLENEYITGTTIDLDGGASIRP